MSPSHLESEEKKSNGPKIPFFKSTKVPSKGIEIKSPVNSQVTKSRNVPTRQAVSSSRLSAKPIINDNPAKRRP